MHASVARQRAWALPLFAVAWLTACGGGGGGGGGASPATPSVPPSTPTPVLTYSVGGTVAGLSGGELVLALNGVEQRVTVRADGGFTFPQALANGKTFAISVETQPAMPAQTCVVAADGASGTLAGADAKRATVQCSVNRYGIGGAVAGLKGQGLVLRLNDSIDLPLASDGSFRFADLQPSGSAYRVQVKTQPQSPAQTCSIGAGGAAGTVAAQDIADVQVQCSLNRYAVSVRVEGLAGSGLVLRNNAADDLALSANGPATFSMQVAADAGYAVTVQRQPTSPVQVCSVVNGVGTAGPTASSVDDVRVVCATSSFVVGGKVVGLSGTGLVLRNNGGDDVVPDSAGRFQFRTPVASGGRFNVTVKAQPVGPSQTCTVNAGTEAGAVTDAAIDGVTVSCATNAYRVGGRLQGLWAASLGLQLNGAEDLELRADGSFRFLKPLASGSSYRIAVKAQPRRPQMTCDVTRGTGTVADAEVTDAVVSCTPVVGRVAYWWNSHPYYSGGIGMTDVDPVTGTIAPRVAAIGNYAASTGTGSGKPVFSADGRFAFIVSKTPQPGVSYAGAVDTVRLDPDTGVPSAGPVSVEWRGPVSVAVHPSGRFVYTPNEGSAVTVFSVDSATGKLTKVQDSGSSGWSGQSTLVDPTGRFLYVLSPNEPQIAVFRINATDGTITPEHTIQPGSNPVRLRMAFHPSGRFLYVMSGGEPGSADNHTGVVYVMAVDPDSGRLTRVGFTGDTGINPQVMDIHPSGRFLYLGNAGQPSSDTRFVFKGSLTAMAIDPVTGLLTRIQPEIEARPWVSCFVVDPSGRFAYVAGGPGADRQYSVLKLYRIDPATGALTLDRELLENVSCPDFRERG